MLSPAEAAATLIRNGHDTPHSGMDDPTEAGPDYRWWWNGAGTLSGAWWRGSTTIYGAFTLANTRDSLVGGCSCGSVVPTRAEEVLRCSDCGRVWPLDDDEWPVNQPLATGAPIPGIHWYSGCEPNRPRVNPSTGVCEGCGEHACPVCEREECGDHA